MGIFLECWAVREIKMRLKGCIKNCKYGAPNEIGGIYHLK